MYFWNTGKKTEKGSVEIGVKKGFWTGKGPKTINYIMADIKALFIS